MRFLISKKPPMSAWGSVTKGVRARLVVMSFTRCWRIALQAIAFAWAATVCADEKPRDLYFSEAMYYAQQGLYFEALARLDAELDQHNNLDEPQLDSLYPLVGSAEFSVGDFELNYRTKLRLKCKNVCPKHIRRSTKQYKKVYCIVTMVLIKKLVWLKH